MIGDSYAIEKTIFDFVVVYNIIILNLYFNTKDENLGLFLSGRTKSQLDLFLSKGKTKYFEYYKIILGESTW